MRSKAAIAASFLLLALVSCGSSGDDTATSTTQAPTTQSPSTTTSLVFRTEAASAPPAGAITVGMSSFKFTPDKLTAKAGTLVLYLVNEEPLLRPGATSDEQLENMHSLAVQNESGLTIAVSDRIEGTKTATFTVEALPAGQYTIVCRISGHGFRGQTGTLEVTA